MIIRLNIDRMMHTTICAFVCDISEICLPTISVHRVRDVWVLRTVAIPVRDAGDKQSFLFTRTDYYLYR